MQISKISAISANNSVAISKNKKTGTQNAAKNNNINLNNSASAVLAKSQITFKGTIAEDLYDYLDKNPKEKESPNYAIKDDINAEFAKIKGQYKLINEAARDMEDVQCIADYALLTFGRAGRTPNKLKLYTAALDARDSLLPKDKNKAQSEVVNVNNQSYITKLNDSPDGQILSATSLTDGIEYNFLSSDTNRKPVDGVFYLKSITTPEYNSPRYKIYFDDNQQIQRVALDYKKSHDNFFDADKVYTINRLYSSDNYIKTRPLETTFSIDTNCRFAAQDTSMILISSDARYTTKKSASNPDLKFGQITSFFSEKLTDENGYKPVYSYDMKNGWNKTVDYTKFGYFK